MIIVKIKDFDGTDGMLFSQVIESSGEVKGELEEIKDEIEKNRKLIEGILETLYDKGVFTDPEIISIIKKVTKWHCDVTGIEIKK